MISQGLRLSEVAWDSDGQTLVWLEGRSDRGVLVCSRLDGQAPRDLTDELNVRAKLGYGGGDFCVSHGHVYFVSNGRIYRQPLAPGRAGAITPGFGEPASPVVSPDGRWLLYVHSCERKDVLAVVDTDGRLWPQVVASGADFYMQPRFSADGRRAAWVSWNHPQMPWDGSRLFLADVDAPSGGPLTFKNARALAGGDNAAVFQPEFSPDGRHLSWLSDAGGGFDFYLHDLSANATRQLSHECGAELALPAWVQGLRTYGWSHDSRSLLCCRNEHGFSSLSRYDMAHGTRTAVTGLEEYTFLQQIAIRPLIGGLAALASSGVIPSRVIATAPAGEPRKTIIAKRATSEAIPAATLVAPRAENWAGPDGITIHGLAYVSEPAGGACAELPPAIIRIHGGPTTQSRASHSAEMQFFATRGYTVLDVNYRGSTGYGRKYMEALRGNWGVCDVEDAVSGARHLVEKGWADPKRMVIMGGSAGGLTVLQTLIGHPGFFKAGVCLYGVSNMLTLAADTHKFEERYLDSLLGPLPQAAALYRERSPFFHADKIRDPLAVFQGETDEVVPREQSDCIVEALRRNKVPHEYHVYPGEGHGWRKTETIEAYFKSVEAFLKAQVIFC
jgi:dipeptidyl aminopeptidase/acylaminoacyl peptidase